MNSVSLTKEEALTVREWLGDEFDKATPITDRVIHAVNKFFGFGGHEVAKTQRDCADMLFSTNISAHNERYTLMGARFIHGIHQRGEEVRVGISEETLRDIREICDALLEAKLAHNSTQICGIR